MYSKTVLLLMIFLSLVTLNKAQKENETLEELIQEAINVSPKIRMLNAKFEITESRIEDGTNLSDPLLTLGLMNMPTNSFLFTQEPMTGKMIGLSQAIPFPGGLSAAAKVKAIDTSIVNQEIEELKNEIRKEVSNLYYDLQLTRVKINLTEISKELFKQISEVVKSKYEVSNSSFQNLIQTEVQISRLNDRLEKLNGEELANLSILNTILLRDESTEISTREIKNPKDILFSITELLKDANENRPFLKGINLAEQKSILQEVLAEYSSYPNFQIGVQYSQRDYNKLTGVDYNDFLSVIVGITLPLNYGGKNSAKINEAKYLQEFCKEQYNSTLQSIQKTLSKIIAKLNELNKRVTLYTNTLLPQAEQSLNAALTDYKVDKIDFVNVVNAENEILNIKTKLAEIRTSINKNLSELEFLVGKKLAQFDNGETQ